MSLVQRVLLPGFAGTELPGWVEQRLRDGLAGVCLFEDNLASATQLVELTGAVLAANPHALVAVDEEGGDVTRLHARVGSPFPGNAVLGRLDDLAATAAVARTVARQLRQAGCMLNLAPCLDVSSDPDNPVIGVRSFGADADLVARHGAAWADAHQAEGVAACAKHFPGHGDTSVDSHVALPVVDRDRAGLRRRELVPFTAAVDAGCWAVMTAHLVLPHVDPDVPATFSHAVLRGLLRGELGFEGVVVSDALDMVGAGPSLAAAAVRALAAGCDLLCLGSYSTEEQVASVEAEVMAAVRDGRLDPALLEGAAARVAVLARRVGPGVPVPGVPVPGVPDVARVLEAFDVSAHARDLLRRPGPWTLVRLDTPPDPATGPTPWGPFASLGEGDRVDADATTVPGGLPAGRLVLVGRGNHRHPWVRLLVDGCRASDREVLVVDMGCPESGSGAGTGSGAGAGRGDADVATYGGSRLVGEALLRLLGLPPPSRRGA